MIFVLELFLSKIFGDFGGFGIIFLFFGRLLREQNILLANFLASILFSFSILFLISSIHLSLESSIILLNFVEFFSVYLF